MWRVFVRCTLIMTATASVLTLALWVRSYWRVDVLVLCLNNVRPPGGGLTPYIASSAGLLTSSDNPLMLECTELGRPFTAPHGPQPPPVQRFDFGPLQYCSTAAPAYYGRYRGIFPTRVMALHGWYGAPHWMVATILAIPAITGLTAARFRWRHRRLRGLCWRCGYDLRATIGRCPECGWMTSPAPVPAAKSGYDDKQP